MYWKESPDKTNFPYHKHISPVPWHFVVSGIYCKNMIEKLAGLLVAVIAMSWVHK